MFFDSLQVERLCALISPVFLSSHSVNGVSHLLSQKSHLKIPRLLQPLLISNYCLSSRECESKRRGENMTIQEWFPIKVSIESLDCQREKRETGRSHEKMRGFGLKKEILLRVSFRLTKSFLMNHSWDPFTSNERSERNTIWTKWEEGERQEVLSRLALTQGQPEMKVGGTRTSSISDQIERQRKSEWQVMLAVVYVRENSSVFRIKRKWSRN